MLAIRTTAGAIAAACTCLPSKDVRYYLNGVCFEQRGETQLSLVATDGHRLIAVEPADDIYSQVDDERENVIISFDKDTLADFRKVSNREKTVKLTVSDTGVEVSYGGITRQAELIEGKYPDWQRIMPSDVAGEGNELAEAAFNARYLSDFYTAGKFLSGSKDCIVEVSTRGMSATLLRIYGARVVGSDESAQLARGVIMPVKM